MIAYVKGSEVWTMTSAGGSQTQLTSTGAASGPTWSPTTTGKIAFASGGTIFTISTGGGAANPLTITGPSGALSHPAWSPDGASIAFQASDGTNIQIWVVAATGGAATKVTDNSTLAADKTAPNWAPTSDAVVFAVAGQGIYSSTRGVGGAWGSPGPEHANTSTADSTPDWQTIVPFNTVLPSINGGASPQTGSFSRRRTAPGAVRLSTGYTYQWERCNSSGGSCANIGGGTAQTYAVVSADIGQTLRVVVTASNVAGQSTPAISNQTGVVTLAGTVNPPVNTVYPVITLPFNHTGVRTSATPCPSPTAPGRARSR